MRIDSIGLFWEDLPPPPKEKKEKEKRLPPDPVWERDDYLPGLNDCISYQAPQMDDHSLLHAWAAGEELVFDIECYPNYFLAAFKSITSGKIIYFELSEHVSLDIRKLRWVLESFTIITFNGNKYDIPLVSLALAGRNNADLKLASDEIILMNERPRDLLKSRKVKMVKVNHIDLFELGHLNASLKIIAGRLHATKMQDLPFNPNRSLTGQQILITRVYCFNDLDNTILMRKKVAAQIDLRVKMSAEYNLDLRSKSDAQVAEAVLHKSITKRTGERLFAPEMEIGKTYRYHIPPYMRYRTPLMNEVLDIVGETRFYVSEFGNIGLPNRLKSMKIPIGNGVYRMGIGGLHSSEKNSKHVAGKGWRIFDWDVTSYYPSIILNQQLYPAHIGRVFLAEYNDIVQRRILAKKSGNNVVADSLKITINGSFGKFGSPYSILYAPQLVIQVTLTGQLTLLLLIELFELSGIKVISANTDGVTAYVHESQISMAENIVKHWEAHTGFNTEQVEYAGIYNRDVNNYVAIKTDRKVKLKGVFAETGMSKNPAGEIIVEAVIEALCNNTPVEQTVKGCTDIRKFLFVRTVKGGAVKDGEYLGKAIRWYYSNQIEGEIVYAKSGNKVPNSECSRPCMNLPHQFPTDINYDRYIDEAYEYLNLWS